MSGLRIHTSNKLEILVDKLAEMIAAKPLVSTLAGETVIVQSKGMERWISIELAKRHGICANYRFPFPNRFARMVFEEFLDELPDETGFETAFMTWKIMNRLPSLLNLPGFKSLKTYLENDNQGLKLYQLACRIAETFDQYLVFRPDMILGWAKGTPEHWQAVLWQEIVGDNEIAHRAALREKFLKKAKNSTHKINNLPERVSVFGISALPPFHISIFNKISKYIEVNLFLMNPCQEYWSDIVSDWETHRFTRAAKKPDHTAKDLYLEKGNSLLASMGALGRDFFSLINELDIEEHAYFKDTEPDNMLSTVQSDILNLCERGKADDVKSICEDDLSLQVHSCHSPMREIEVLHDYILAMFESDPELMPGNILVMTPDIEQYAPFIQAVFDKQSANSRNIPFSIADRSFRYTGTVSEIILKILNLSGSRFEASKVFSILESPCVYKKFDLQISDLEIIRRWIDKTRIRWGIDENHRRQLGFSSYRENSWRAGLERLLLGCALPANNERLYEDILPFDDIEGEYSITLGKFAEFIEQLFSCADLLNQSHSLTGWKDVLLDILEKFIQTDEEIEREIQKIRQLFLKFLKFQDESGYDDKISLEVVKSYLKREFDNQDYGFGFIDGAVTFCAMLPMRSIPFKIICMIGLNDNSFPRQTKPLSFDLMAKSPMPGDRSRRNDDRYLFLEAIFSAREKLYISYVGQSITDNTIIPPSVVISELFDYIENAFKIPDKNILEHVVIKHRLQPFNPEYFKSESKLCSYSEENCKASRIMAAHRIEPKQFIEDGLTVPDDEFRTIEIEQLCRFFVNPAEYLLKNRLGIILKRDASILDDRESFAIDGLEKYKLEEYLLSKMLEGVEYEKLFLIKKAQGELPPGKTGKLEFDESVRNVQNIVDTVTAYIAEPLQPFEIDLDISGFKLAGRVDSIYSQGLIQYRAASVKVKDRLKTWIYHLILNTARPDSYPNTSFFIGSDKVYKYKPVENSKEILKQLLEIYWNGLIKPIPFFPDTSFKYSELARNNSSEDIAIKKAEIVYLGDKHNRGEIDNYSIRQCFGNVNPLDDNFKSIALTVFEPILNHEEKVKL